MTSAIKRGNCTFPWWYLPRWFYRYFYPCFSREEEFSRETHWQWKNENGKKQDGGGDEDVFKVVFFGDFMPTAEAPKVVDEKLGALFASADAIVGNLETPLIEKEEGGVMGFLRSLVLHSFQQDELQRWLDVLGLDTAKLYLSLANNHVFDMGDVGYFQTIGMLEDMGVTVIGHTTNPTIVTLTEGIGLLAWTHWLNIEGKASTADITRGDTVKEMDMFEEKKDKNISTLIGFPHWGIEFNYFPATQTQQHAKDFVNNGFDMLVGGHSHTPQPIVSIQQNREGEEGGCNQKSAIVAYSLGDFNGFTFPPFLQLKHVCVGQVISASFSKSSKALLEYDVKWVEYKPYTQEMILHDDPITEPYTTMGKE
eukprot:m.132380 g.132380  ORF g.132380 m.132380 type:complete len:367 (-) comp9483_c1_seq1:1720-2820(-)